MSLFALKIILSIASAVLVFLTILQSKDEGVSSIGSAFGGSNSFYITRRGIEKGVFIFTFILMLAIGFIAFAMMMAN